MGLRWACRPRKRKQTRKALGMWTLRDGSGAQPLSLWVEGAGEVDGAPPPRGRMWDRGGSAVEAPSKLSESPGTAPIPWYGTQTP